MARAVRRLVLLDRARTALGGAACLADILGIGRRAVNHKLAADRGLSAGEIAAVANALDQPKPIALTSPGPVAEAFMRSRAFIVVIIGPVGSGKTMAMLQKGVRNGAMQGARIDERGIKRRRAKFGVIRESYPSLDANTLPSWFNITPKEYGHFSAKAPYSHKFQRVLRRDASRQPTDVLDMEVEFRAIGDQARGIDQLPVGSRRAFFEP
ncbi:hypothetical protein EMGR_005688 [Emarellia grisea]